MIKKLASLIALCLGGAYGFGHEAPLTSQCYIRPLALSLKASDFKVEEYLSPDRSQFVVFSRHSTSLADNKLKRLFQRFETYVLTERQVDRLQRQILSELRVNKVAIDADWELLSLIKAEHKKRPFSYFVAEFSEQDRSRFMKRIEYANSVETELLRQTRLSPAEIDSYLLMLVGEDVYPLLAGRFLSHLPVFASEDQALLSASSKSLGQCYALRGRLKLSRDLKAKEIAKELGSFFRPRPELESEYRAFKSKLIMAIKADGLLRLRAGIEFIEDIEKKVSSCDALFDLDRDNFLATMMISELPPGRGLLTRGIGHAHLLPFSFESACENLE